MWGAKKSSSGSIREKVREEGMVKRKVKWLIINIYCLFIVILPTFLCKSKY